MSHKITCFARAAWYRTEKYRLKWERLKDPDTYNWNPLVTVIIPTFNRCDLLMQRALSSVLAQTYKNMEIIVAAHGCTDGTHEAVEILLYRRVRLLKVPRTRTYPPTAENHWLVGPVVPANAALRVAKGDWIARIDDDDTWTPTHIEELLAFARKGDYEFVSSAYETHEGIVYSDGGTPPIGGVQTWLCRDYLKFMKFNPDCWMKCWDAVNDTDLADRFRKAGVRIGWLNEVTAHVLPRPGETEIGSKAYLDDAKTVERYLEF